MAEFEKGQIFLNHRSSNYYSSKPKYFIALSSANEEDDHIVCFVMNTERNMGKYHLNCNRKDEKFIIPPKRFPFIKKHTSIMLSLPCFYTLKEMYEDYIELLDVADDLLCRQIKVCINWKSIPPKFGNLIKESFI